MLKRRGIVIHDTDCGPYWAQRLESSGLNTVGVHPAGGIDAHLSLASCMEFVKTERFRAFKERVNRAGIAVEFEMHALSWLLPRDLFRDKPDWFRMEENGERDPRFNCCASSRDALAFIRDRTKTLAEAFPSDTHRYHFWIDDVAEAKCRCPLCRDLSASDQALILTNAIAEGVRRTDPEGLTAYLAYCGTLKKPERAEPLPFLFLEFAPIGRAFEYSLFDPDCEKNAEQTAHLPALLDFFGRENAKVLDYWVDNSLFSGWTLPPKKFEFNAGVCRADVKEYAERGFSSVTSFGCYLGENYRELWGDAPVGEYFRILSEI
ncbi:MAG: DUF4838 domain-containing protein [Ruminococcaceae bacterium]|jgi:hypothetical protein|nr:DUF4838 domain-containing protein [Oscillospiraceae bacterium]